MGKISKAFEKAEKNIHKDDLKVGSTEKDNSRDAAPGLSKENLVREKYLSEAIQEPEDNYSKAEVVPENGSNELITISKPFSIVSEQFRLLKTNILFPETGEPPRTIMITSPSPHEGKSFVAGNLAVSIAQSIDEYVLLMDCDLRHPSIHSLFGLDGSEQGLSEYLSSGLSLSSVLKKTFVKKLTILPGGSIPSNPSELLSSEQMRRMLHEVKLRYRDRYIIIDTPPPYITSETNAIARYVDGIIIVVRHGKTRIKEVQDIVDIYGKNKILGVIKNFSQKSIGYGYGYHKYGYGYHKQT